MRTWVEKLAKRIEKGKSKDLWVTFDNISVSVNCLKPTLYVVTKDRSADIKLYDDEYDLLKEAKGKATELSKQYFIDIFESFSDEVTNESENDID